MKKSNNNFIDLQEIDSPEELDIINNKDISRIDSIEFINKDYFFENINSGFNKDLMNNSGLEEYPRIDVKQINQSSKNNAQDRNKTNSIEPSVKNYNKESVKQSGLLSKANAENKILSQKQKFLQPKKENGIEELEIIPDEKEVISDFKQKIHDDDNENVEYPGNVSLESIDKKLSNSNLVEIDDEFKDDKESEEVLGVNRTKVFYSIDKNIYSKRTGTVSIKEKLKNIKKGLFLPVFVSILSFFLIIPISIGFSIYFKNTSKTSLEENFINDKSILAEIAKKKDQEAKLAGLKLEEERKKLDDERSQMKNTINEQMLKKEAEIQEKYNQRLKDLEKSGISTVEIEKYKKEAEKEKEDALKQAQEERNQKITEQEKVIQDKDKRITDAMDSLTKQSQNYEAELIQLRSEYEAKNKEESSRVEQATQRLSEIKEIQDKIDNFNQMVYQLINNAIIDFKNNDLDNAVLKLDTLLKYYNSNLDFANSNPNLKNKMATDIFFVETIKSLIDESKNNIMSNRDLSNIIDKFRSINASYQRAENLYNSGNLLKSLPEYEDVLKGFDEVNNSYKKIIDINKIGQNIKAEDYYNKAKENMKNEKFDVTLTLLSSVIREAPESDYANSALNDILSISGSLSLDSRINKDNEKAVGLMNDADKLVAESNYQNALKLFENVIAIYPFSNYTKKALDNIKNIYEINNRNNLGSKEAEIKSNFSESYKKFQDYYNKNDLEDARKYYFDALKKAFDIYTDNSISNFKIAEDRYIEELVKDKTKSFYNKSSAENSKVSNETIINLEKQLNTIKSQYSDLENKYNEKLKINSNDIKKDFSESYEKFQYYYRQNDLENARKYYFEALKKAFDMYTNNSITTFKIMEDKYIEKLLENREVLTIDKMMNQNDAGSSNKIKDLKSQLDELKNKYIELERKYNAKTDDSKLRTEIEKQIEVKYKALKDKEVEIEKAKIQKDFDEQLAKIKGGK